MSTPPTHGAKAIYHRPAELLQQLIRFNTTNPPGNEAVCIHYLNRLLSDAGMQTTLLARDPARPNLIARLAGQGSAPPLLLQGHVDVVTAEKQVWQHPPFAGDIFDDYIWGRGALDMKGGVAMMVSACLRAQAEGIPLPGDVLLIVLSDEEAGGEYGAKFLVEELAGLFEGVRYALGEFGGFTMHIAGQKFYPIQVMEKKTCGLKAVIHGPGGHGALPMRGGASAKLGRLGQIFDPMLHNTVNVTIIRGGEKSNVIPSEIVVTLDGRLLPGFEPDDLLAELRQIAGDTVSFSVKDYDPGPAVPDMSFFDTLATILREADPEGTPLPMLMPAVTDGRFFSRLGIQTYGFLPMILPEGFNFSETIHAADERIPVAAMDFGANAIFEALRRNKH